MEKITTSHTNYCAVKAFVSIDLRDSPGNVRLQLIDGIPKHEILDTSYAHVLRESCGTCWRDRVDSQSAASTFYGNGERGGWLYGRMWPILQLLYDTFLLISFREILERRSVVTQGTRTIHFFLTRNRHTTRNTGSTFRAT